MGVKIHPTAIIEDGVHIGDGTAIWSFVHIRQNATLGEQCIVGDNTTIAYETKIGNRVKINGFVNIVYGVEIEDGVMIAAGVMFANELYPRAASPDLLFLNPSQPTEKTLKTRVGEGTTIGTGAIIGPGIELGRFSMVGMGSVVTRSVPPFHLVIGNPARPVGLVCRCGEPIAQPGRLQEFNLGHRSCRKCHRAYQVSQGQVIELES